MTIFKSPEYPCLRICNVDDAKVIDWICTGSKLIWQSEPNKYLNKTRKTTNVAQRRRLWHISISHLRFIFYMETSGFCTTMNNERLITLWLRNGEKSSGQFMSRILLLLQKIPLSTLHSFMFCSCFMGKPMGCSLSHSTNLEIELMLALLFLYWLFFSSRNFFLWRGVLIGVRILRNYFRNLTI